MTVVDRQDRGSMVECGFHDVELKLLVVRDQSGNVIKQTQTGSQVTLEVTYDNKCIYSQPTIVILEVRALAGITNYVTWQNVTTGSAGQAILQSSWVAPEKPGYYDVRAFAFSLSALHSTEMLHSVLTYRLAVLPSGFE